jgi:hypothetical protein
MRTDKGLAEKKKQIEQGIKGSDIGKVLSTHGTLQAFVRRLGASAEHPP